MAVTTQSIVTRKSGPPHITVMVGFMTSILPPPLEL